MAAASDVTFAPLVGRGDQRIASQFGVVDATASIYRAQLLQEHPSLPRLFAADEVFDRRSAAKLYRIFVTEHGDVNPTAGGV